MSSYFLDTEFYDVGHGDLRLVSLALVADDGRELYFAHSQWLADDGTPTCHDEWLSKNVFPHLPNCGCPEHDTWRRSSTFFVHASACRWRNSNDIAAAIKDFVLVPEDGSKATFWAFVASYDWVLFCWLFGKLMDLPKHFNWLVHDLKVWGQTKGYTGSFKDLLPTTGHHDALCDARWNRDVHRILVEKGF